MPIPIKKQIQALLGDGISAGTRRFALHGTLGNVGLQMLSILLVFGLQIIIARVGGEEAYGLYSQVFNWIGVLFAIAIFGVDTLLLRQVPIYQSQGDRQGIRRVFLWTLRRVCVSSLVVISIFALVVNWGKVGGLSDNAYYFNASLATIFFGALAAQLQGLMKGAGKVVWGSSADRIVKPLGLSLGVLLFWVLGRETEMASYVWANIFAFGLACAYAAALAYRELRRIGNATLQPATHPTRNDETPTPGTYDGAEWKQSAFHFGLAALLYILSVRLDVLAVGHRLGNIATGHYNVALKYADLAILPYFIVSHSISPLYSRLQEQGAMEELQNLFTTATRWVFFATVGIFFGFALFGQWILALFGDNFEVAYHPLLILGVGRLFSSFVGPVGMLMMMLGLEKENNMGLAAQIVVMSLGLHFFIPIWGLDGAALAACMGVVTFQCLMARWLYLRKGIRASVFG